MSRIFILIKLILNLLWKYVHTSSPMFIPFNFYCYYFKHKTQSDVKNSKAKKRLFLIYHTKKKKKKKRNIFRFWKIISKKVCLKQQKTGNKAVSQIVKVLFRSAVVSISSSYEWVFLWFFNLSELEKVINRRIISKKIRHCL